MNILKVLTLVFFFSLSAFSWAENQTDVQLLDDLEVSCGEKIKADEVLVLDLEPYAQQQGSAAEFVQRQVEEYQLVTPTPVLIPKILSDERDRRTAMLKQSRYEAAARGCNLVLVQAVEIVNNEYQTIAVTHDSVPGSFGRSDYKARVNLGYALVLMGTKID